jgi:hypothetical protein
VAPRINKTNNPNEIKRITFRVIEINDPLQTISSSSSSLWDIHKGLDGLSIVISQPTKIK